MDDRDGGAREAAGGGWAVERRAESAARLRLYEQVAAKITEAHLSEILAIADRAARRGLLLGLASRCMRFLAGFGRGFGTGFGYRQRKRKRE